MIQESIDRIKGKPIEEIREAFGIVNDYTPEEEEELITLKTSDGEEFKLGETIAVRSEVIKNIVQDMNCTSNVILLSNVDQRKTIEEIREVFSIVNDYTLEDEEERKPFHSQVAPTYYSNKVKGYFTRCMASSTVGAQPSFSTLAISTNEPVVSVDWLHANIRDPDLKVLDASWYMPDEHRNPLQEYQVACIPGALFFDIDGITDRTTNVRYLPCYVISPHERMLQLAILHAFEMDFITFYDIKALLTYQLPHMSPSEEAFAAAVSALGIKNKDVRGCCIRWQGNFQMFRAFGHDKVWVLEGGLPRWRASGYNVESTAPGDAILKSSAATEAIEKVYQVQMVR
ncbi:hypothetical protein H5410_007887 [Solanum commersonii]|uniref:Rhodanese domain-containing protein n=1 Tax=Solanum commersonii TaxID=4109 RepID=A0A9J6ADD3_SOLCO|nr:hypothetical protein H5410_007887 [Solanum commersonii]